MRILNQISRIAALLSAALLVALLAPATRLAYACSCAAPDPPQLALEKAAAVFEGEVKSVDVPAGTMISGNDPVTVLFDVRQVWKGPVAATLAAQTARSDASCGYSFLAGQAYLVYASGSELNLQVSLCSRTRPVGDAAEDLAVLGSGQVVQAAPAQVAQPQGASQPAAYAGGWGTLALINAGLAQCKNRSGANWFLISILLGPLATLLLVAVDPKLPPASGQTP
jgi:hypothetical protein